jgi:hypothetical protein
LVGAEKGDFLRGEEGVGSAAASLLLLLLLLILGL